MDDPKQSDSTRINARATDFMKTATFMESITPCTPPGGFEVIARIRHIALAGCVGIGAQSRQFILINLILNHSLPKHLICYFIDIFFSCLNAKFLFLSDVNGFGPNCAYARISAGKICKSYRALAISYRRAIGDTRIKA